MGKRKGKRGKKNNGGGNGQWGSIQLGGFRAQFPQPRLPFRLGADTKLPTVLSVYPRVRLDVPIITMFAALASGAMAATFGLDISRIQGWSSRFATLFREYAIVGARLEIRPQNVSPASGLIAAFLDEESGAAPISTDALNRPRLDMIAGPITVPKAYHLDWKPADILDLDYVAVATVFTPVWVKLYTDNANFGTSVGMTGQVLITGTLAFEFRGYL